METDDSVNASSSESSALTDGDWFASSTKIHPSWDWVIDPDAQIPWETSQFFDRPVDVPSERSEAKKWLRGLLGRGSGGWDNEYLATDYIDALKDAVLIRRDIVSGQLVWDGPSDPLADWETEEWCRIQVIMKAYKFQSYPDNYISTNYSNHLLGALINHPNDNIQADNNRSVG
ncbi:hypothetical protein K435DRAFT_789448 [Dendrothele bispora CBS 962.96]|uniref:Uncharacterized protein n=1 Tax=Dendrothele bispora (strain CBS 962.96) TaxID=1314807 RepID=A0A4S8MV51_DENBC|nr:hypothetical protein K435DRAFT_789448 [Dendrothele bispora CBS 962.96]